MTEEYDEMLGIPKRADSVTPPANTSGRRGEVISLSGGRSVTIGWPDDLTLADWTEIRVALESITSKMVTTACANDKEAGGSPE